jgi:uncharacterized protein (TIGR02300 family)
MTKPEWGVKRTCEACNARFYDMERSPVVCPKCGHEFTPVAIIPLASTVPEPVEEKAPVKVVRYVDGEELDLDDVDIDLDDVDLTEDPEAEDDLIEDMSELEHDEEDMSEVMEHVEPDDDR